MRFEDAAENLSAYMDGELDAEKTRELEALLEKHESLRKQLQLLKSSRSLLKTHGSEKMPEALRRRILNAVDEEPSIWARPWFRPAVGFAFAAAAVTVVVRFGNVPTSFQQAAGSLQDSIPEKASLLEAAAPPPPAEPATRPGTEGGRLLKQAHAPSDAPVAGEAAAPTKPTVERQFSEAKDEAAPSGSFQQIAKNERFGGVKPPPKTMAQILREKEEEREARPVSLRESDLTHRIAGAMLAPQEKSDSARMMRIPQLGGNALFDDAGTNPLTAMRTGASSRSRKKSPVKRRNLMGASPTLASMGVASFAETRHENSAESPEIRIDARAQVFRSSEPWQRFWLGRRRRPPEVDFEKNMAVVLVPIDRVDPRYLEILEPAAPRDPSAPLRLPYRFVPPNARNIRALQGKPPFPVRLLPRSKRQVIAEQVP